MLISRKKLRSYVLLASFINIYSLGTCYATETNLIREPLVATSTVNNKDKEQLINKINKMSYFSAGFRQTVVDHEGNALQEGRGVLTINKPNLVHWQTLTPDENLIVSDGENLWFYDPFIEQVTIYSLTNALSNTPILLLTNNDASLWDAYQVQQKQADVFLVTAVNTNSQIHQLELTFNGDLLNRLSIVDATGQVSNIQLENIDISKAPEASLFKFIVPDGVSIDDQR